MTGFNDFEFWRQHHEELLREAEMNRLAQAALSNRKKKLQQASATDRKLQRYDGQLSRLLHTLTHKT